VLLFHASPNLFLNISQSEPLTSRLWTISLHYSQGKHGGHLVPT